MSEEITYEKVNNTLKKTIPQPGIVTFETKEQVLGRKQNIENQMAIQTAKMQQTLDEVNFDLAKCEELEIKSQEELTQ